VLSISTNNKLQTLKEYKLPSEKSNLSLVLLVFDAINLNEKIQLLPAYPSEAIEVPALGK